MNFRINTNGITLTAYIESTNADDIYKLADSIAKDRGLDHKGLVCVDEHMNVIERTTKETKAKKLQAPQTHTETTRDGVYNGKAR